MAVTGQTFVKFDGDSFTIRFTVTDGTNISGYAVWFGMTHATTWNGVANGTTLQRRAGTWIDPATDSNCPGDSSVSANVSAGGVSITADKVEVTINYSDTLNFDYDGGFNSDGNFLFELVLSESGGQCQSTVVASGTMNIQQALFNSQDYRGI